MSGLTRRTALAAAVAAPLFGLAQSSTAVSSPLSSLIEAHRAAADAYARFVADVMEPAWERFRLDVDAIPHVETVATFENVLGMQTRSTLR